MIACLVLVVSFVSISMVRDTQSQFNEMADHILPEIELIRNVRYLALRIVTSTNELGLIYAEQRVYGDEFGELYEEEREELDEEIIRPFEQASDELEKFVQKYFPDESDEVMEILELGEQIKQGSLDLISRKEAGVTGLEILEIKQELEEVEEAFLEAIDEALEHETEEMDERNEALSSTITSGIKDIQFTGLVTLAVAILLGILIARHLAKPIRALAMASDAIGKGRLDTRVAVETGDEIGQLANSFNAMIEALSRTTVSKNYVENILASMGDALFVLDSQGRITRTNKAVSKLLGYDEDELNGSPFADLFGSQGTIEHTCLSLTGRDPQCECDTVSLSRNGGHVPVHLSSALLYNDGGEMIGAVYLAKDIRERLRAEQALAEKNAALEHSNEELEKFAYVVSHDLKAPLRAIANLATWIEEDLEGKLDEDTQKNMELMHSRVQRMESLINGILEYSRIGRTNERVEDVDVQRILTEVVDSMPTPEGFTINVDDNMPVIPASPVRLGQVFSNLISNAIKYRRDDGGHVDVSVFDNDGFYRFSVADNGPGIAPEYHDKVFVIFQTLNARDKVESTGVGLTLIKKIIEEQGGKITLESEEGKGATFSFTWPKQLMEMERKTA